MQQDTILYNLIRIRKVANLSQEKLARRLKLSPSAYRKLEQGKSEPSVKELHALAAALDIPLRYLLEDVQIPSSVRFRSNKLTNKIKREQILVEVARWLSNFQKIENILGKKGLLGKNIVHQFDSIRNQIKTSNNKAEDAAKLMRASLKMRKDEPVLNICGLLESHGIRVIDICKPDSKDFFGLSVADVNEGGSAVVVNTCDKISVERWIFTAVHELGHLIMHLSDYGSQCTVEEKKEEQEANAFAAAFLMPDTAFLKEWHGSSGLDFVDRVIKVKRIFRVSYRTVLYRLAPHAKDINIWAHFQKAYKSKHRRALLRNDEPEALAADAFRATFPEPRSESEPDKLSPVDFIQDGLYGLVRTAIEKEKISLDRGAELLDISLQDMRKRTLSWVA